MSAIFMMGSKARIFTPVSLFPFTKLAERDEGIRNFFPSTRREEIPLLPLFSFL